MNTSHTGQTMRRCLLLATFFSGATGLVFEIIFRRQLLLTLGVTHYSVGAILTVFMAGLGLGSYLFGRSVDRIQNPARLYGLLELGIGVSGIFLVFFLPHFEVLYSRLTIFFSSGESPNILLKTALAGSVLLVPTTLMGGTIPVLGKSLARTGEPTGAPLGLIYGLNTMGGVLGVLGATFWLLTVLGSAYTLSIISCFNMLLGLCILSLSRGQKNRHETVSAAPPLTSNVSEWIVFLRRNVLLLAVFFISGFASLSLEVHWTRILAYVVGSHGYAFGIIVAAFLMGIALGSLIMSRFVDKVKRPILLLGIVQLLIAVFSLLVGRAMFELRGFALWLADYAEGSWTTFITFEVITLFCLFLLPTIAMGMVFPLVMNLIAREYSNIGSHVGRAYAVNTAGSILGAFLGGFVFYTLLGNKPGSENNHTVFHGRKFSPFFPVGGKRKEEADCPGGTGGRGNSIVCYSPWISVAGACTGREAYFLRGVKFRYSVCQGRQ